MNKRIQKLFNQAGFHQPEMERLGIEGKFEKFAELIVTECTQLLFEESERLHAYASECDSFRESDEAESCAEKCIDNIEMIEKHFGIE